MLTIKNFRVQQINSANGIIPLIFYLSPAGQLPCDFLQSIQNLEDPQLFLCLRAITLFFSCYRSFRNRMHNHRHISNSIQQAGIFIIAKKIKSSKTIFLYLTQNYLKQVNNENRGVPVRLQMLGLGPWRSRFICHWNRLF